MPTGSPGLRIRSYPGVDREVRDALLALGGVLRREMRFTHPVRVTVVRQAGIDDESDAPAWGLFLIPDDYVRGDPVRIYVSAGSAALFSAEFGFSRARSVREVVFTLAHEIAHYQQWRRRQALDEQHANEVADECVASFLALRPEYGP